MADQGIDASAIREAVDILYERLLADPVISRMWAGVNLSRLRGHQRAFLLQALGGPALYSGRDMKAGHTGLGITDDQFARMVSHLVASLRDVGVAEDVVERATSDLQGLRALIVEL